LSGHFGIEIVQSHSLTHLVENMVDPFCTHLADVACADPDAVTPENKWAMGVAW
jgi:hypothetical protein